MLGLGEHLLGVRLRMEEVLSCQLAKFEHLDHVFISEHFEVLSCQLSIRDVLQYALKISNVSCLHDMVKISLGNRVPVQSFSFLFEGERHLNLN